MDAEARLNEVADLIAAEGMIVRASKVREGAAEIARQRHENERLKAAMLEAFEALNAQKWSKAAAILYRATLSQ
jgi:hypothetical protein